MDAGIGAFGEKGYAATTVDEIAALARVSRATFYLHFDGKAALLSHAAQHLGEWAPELYNGLDGTGDIARNRVEKVVRTIFHHWRDNAGLLTALIEAEAVERDSFDAILPSVNTTVDRAFPRYLSQFSGRALEVARAELTMLVVLTYRYMYYAFGRKPFPSSTSIETAAMTDLIWRTLNNRASTSVD